MAMRQNERKRLSRGLGTAGSYRAGRPGRADQVGRAGQIGRGGRGVVSGGKARVSTTGRKPLYAQRRAGLLARQNLRKYAGQAAGKTSQGMAVTGPQWGIQQTARERAYGIARKHTVLDYELRSDAEDRRRYALQFWARYALNERTADRADTGQRLRLGMDQSRIELDKKRFDAQYGPEGFAQQELNARTADRTSRRKLSEGQQNWREEGRTYDRGQDTAKRARLDEGRTYDREQDKIKREWRERDKASGAPGATYFQEAQRQKPDVFKDNLGSLDSTAVKQFTDAAKYYHSQHPGLTLEEAVEQMLLPGGPRSDTATGTRKSQRVPAPDSRKIGSQVDLQAKPRAALKSPVPEERPQRLSQRPSQRTRRLQTRLETGGGYKAWRDDLEREPSDNLAPLHTRDWWEGQQSKGRDPGKKVRLGDGRGKALSTADRDALKWLESHPEDEALRELLRARGLL